MAQTNINIRIDETDKRLFDEICGQLGMTMSARCVFQFWSALTEAVRRLFCKSEANPAEYDTPDGLYSHQQGHDPDI